MVSSRSGVRLYAVLHAPGLVSCVRQHASCQPRRPRRLVAVAGLFFYLFRMRGAARQSAATSKTGFVVNCSSSAVQLQEKQSQRLRLYPYVSHREGSIVLLPAANLRRPPDKYGLLTLGCPSVRCTPRSGSGVLCSAARFVSAKKATMAARGSRAHIFDMFRMRGAARQSEASSMSCLLYTSPSPRD